MPFEFLTIKNPAEYLAQHHRPSTSPQARHHHRFRRHTDDVTSTFRSAAHEHRHREHRDVHFDNVQSENVARIAIDKSRPRPAHHHQGFLHRPNPLVLRNADPSHEAGNYRQYSSKHHSRREVDDKALEAQVPETRLHRSHRHHHKHRETAECFQSVNDERASHDSRVSRVYKRSTEVTMHQLRDKSGLVPLKSKAVHYRSPESSRPSQQRLVADRPKRRVVNRIEGTTWSTTMYPTPMEYISAGARGVFDKIRKTLNIGAGKMTKPTAPAEAINADKSPEAVGPEAGGTEAEHVVQISVGVAEIHDNEETKGLAVAMQTDVVKSAEKCDITTHASGIVVAPCLSEAGKALTRKDGRHEYGEREDPASESGNAREDGIISTPSDALSVLTSNKAWADTEGLSDISLKEFMEFIKHKRDTSAKHSEKLVKAVQSNTSRGNSPKYSGIKLHGTSAAKESSAGLRSSRMSISSSCSTCKVKPSKTTSQVLAISRSKPSSLNGRSSDSSRGYVSSTVTITGDASATPLRLSAIHLENASRRNIVRAQSSKVIAESLSLKKVMSPQSHRSSVRTTSTRNSNVKSDLNKVHTNKSLCDKDITPASLQERYSENLRRKKSSKVEPSLKEVLGAKKDQSSASIRLRNKTLKDPLRQIRSNAKCESTERSSDSSTEGNESFSSESMSQRLSNYKNRRTRSSRSKVLRDLSSESMKQRHEKTAKKKTSTRKPPKAVLEFGFLGESTDDENNDISSSESSQLRRSFKKIPFRQSVCRMVDFSAENVDEMPRFVQVMPALAEASSLEELSNNNKVNESPEKQPTGAMSTEQRDGRLPVAAPRRLRTARTEARRLSPPSVLPPRDSSGSRESKSRVASVERPPLKDNETPRAKSQETKAKPPPKVAPKPAKPLSEFAQNMARLKKRNDMFREKARARRKSLNKPAKSEHSSEEERSRSRSRRTVTSTAQRGNSGRGSRDASSDSGGDHKPTLDSRINGTARGQPEENTARSKKRYPQRTDNKRSNVRGTKSILKCSETSVYKSTRTEVRKRKQESVMRSASSLKALGRVDFSEEGLGNLPRYIQIMPCEVTHKPGYKLSGKLLTSDEFLSEAEERLDVKEATATMSAVLLARTAMLLERGEALHESFLKKTSSSKSTASKPMEKPGSKLPDEMEKQGYQQNTQNVHACAIPERKKQEDDVTRQKVKKAPTTFAKRANSAVPASRAKQNDDETGRQRNSSQDKEINVEGLKEKTVSRPTPVKVEGLKETAMSQRTPVKVEGLKETAMSQRTPVKVEGLKETTVNQRTPVKLEGLKKTAVNRPTPVPRPRGRPLSLAVDRSKDLNTKGRDNEATNTRQDKERVAEAIDTVTNQEKSYVERIDKVFKLEKSADEETDKVMNEEMIVEVIDKVMKQEKRSVKGIGKILKIKKRSVKRIDRMRKLEKNNVEMIAMNEVMNEDKSNVEVTDKVMKPEERSVEGTNKVMQQEKSTEVTDEVVLVAASDSMNSTNAYIKPKSLQSSNRVFEVKHVDSEENTSTIVKPENGIPSCVNPEPKIEKTKSENITSSSPSKPMSKSESVTQLELTTTSPKALSTFDNLVPFEVSAQTIIENVTSETASPVTSAQRIICKTNVNCVDIAYEDSEASSYVETDTDYDDMRSSAMSGPDVNDVSETSSTTSGVKIEEVIDDVLENHGPSATPLDRIAWPGRRVSTANSSSLITSPSSSNTSLGEHDRAYLTYGDLTSERTEDLSASGTESPLEYQTFSRESLVSSAGDEASAKVDRVTLPSRDDVISNINEKLRRHRAETVMQSWSRYVPSRDEPSLSGGVETPERCDSLSPVSSTSLDRWRNTSVVDVKAGRVVDETTERFSLTRVLERERLMNEQGAQAASVVVGEAGYREARERGRKQGAIPRHASNQNVIPGDILPVPETAGLDGFVETRSYSVDVNKQRKRPMNVRYLQRGEDQLGKDNNRDALQSTTPVNQSTQDDLLLNAAVDNTDDPRHSPAAYLHTVNAFRSGGGPSAVDDGHPMLGGQAQREQYYWDSRNQTTRDYLMRGDRATAQSVDENYEHGCQGLQQRDADVNDSSRGNPVPAFDYNAHSPSTTPPQTAPDLTSVRETRDDVISVPRGNAQQSFATTLKATQDLVEVQPTSARDQQTSTKIQQASAEQYHLETEAPTSRKQPIPDETKRLGNPGTLDRTSNVGNQVPPGRKRLCEVQRLSKSIGLQLAIGSRMRETERLSQLESQGTDNRGGQDPRDKHPDEEIGNCSESKAIDQLRPVNQDLIEHSQVIDPPRAQMASQVHATLPSTGQEILETRIPSPGLNMQPKRVPTPEDQFRVPLNMNPKQVPTPEHQTQIPSPGPDMNPKRVPSPDPQTQVPLDLNPKRVPTPEHQTRIPSPGLNMQPKRVPTTEDETWVPLVMNPKRVPSPEDQTRVPSSGHETRVPSPGLNMNPKRVPSPDHQTRVPSPGPLDRTRSAKRGSPSRRPPLTSPPTAHPPSPGPPITDTARKKRWYQKIMRGKRPTPSTLALSHKRTIEDIYYNATCASQDDVASNQSESGLLYPNIIEQAPKHAFKRYPR